MHVGQAEVAAGVAEGQLFVIHAQQVQQGGVEVVDVHAVLRRLEAEVVGLAVAHAAARAAAGQEHAETVRVVVATVAVLAHRRAPELAAPHDQRVFEQAALLQVAEQGGDGAVNVLAEIARCGVVIRVRIPRLAVAVIDLDETHAAFRQASRHETAVREVPFAVSLAHRRRLARDVEGVRRRELHPIGRLHRLDAALQRRVRAAARGEVLAVHLAQQVELLALCVWRGARVVQPWNHRLGVEVRVVDVAAAVLRRQERARPQDGEPHGPAGAEHDVAR